MIVFSTPSGKHIAKVANEIEGSTRWHCVARCGVSIKPLSKDLVDSVQKDKTDPRELCFQCVVLEQKGYANTTYANLTKGHVSPKLKIRDDWERSKPQLVVSLIRDEKTGDVYPEQWDGTSLKMSSLKSVSKDWWERKRTSEWVPISKTFSRAAVKAEYWDGDDGDS